MSLSPRAEVLRKLNTAVSEATAGELLRAADFLSAARKIRLGKRQIRNKWRGKTETIPAELN